jgi:hypothetical protein
MLFKKTSLIQFVVYKKHFVSLQPKKHKKWKTFFDFLKFVGETRKNLLEQYQ